MGEKIKICKAYWIIEYGALGYIEEMIPITNDMLTGRYKLEWAGDAEAYMSVEIKYPKYRRVLPNTFRGWFKGWDTVLTEIREWIPEKDIRFNYGYPTSEETVKCSQSNR